MLRACDERDFEAIWEIVNDGAEAYRGVIPADRWHEPYMSREELAREMAAGVRFWGCEQEGRLVGVMGVQDVLDVTLVRHAYVVTRCQRQGIGARLLSRLVSGAARPVLIGTWADAVWAIRFYQKHGFRLVAKEEIAPLLHRYWKIPERQVETSVVLVGSAPHR